MDESNNACDSGSTELMKDGVNEVEFNNLAISPGKMSRIASAMQRKKTLDLVRFSECGLNDELMEILVTCLKNSSLKIKDLNVSGNINLGVRGFADLGYIVSHCEVENLYMIWMAVTAAKLQAFKDNTRYAKIKNLDVSGNTSMGIEGMAVLGSIVSQCDMENISMGCCRLKGAEIKSFRNQLQRKKLKGFDVWGNESLHVDGLAEVGSVVSQCQVENVSLAYCGMSRSEMEAFKNNTRGAKIQKLDVSNNLMLSTEGIAEVGSVVSQCEVESVNLGDCGLSSSLMEEFKNNTRGAKFKELNLSENYSLRAEGIAEVGSVVSQCEVENVNMSKCNLNSRQMKAFKRKTRGARINHLDLSGNVINKTNGLGNKGLSIISKVVRQCQIKVLVMEACCFEEDQLESFRELITETGVDFVT